MGTVQLRERAKPKTSKSIWEKKVDGRVPSMFSGRPIILTFCRLLCSSKSATVFLRDSLSRCMAEHAVSSCWMRWSVSVALSSKEVIRCPWSVTFVCRVSNVEVSESNDDLKSAASAILCSSSRELISAMLMLALADDTAGRLLSGLPLGLDILMLPVWSTLVLKTVAKE